MKVTTKNPVIAWWSGGIASAVTCKICLDTYGKENVRVVFIDTFNEHPDTYRFLKDCEKWYGLKIETISNPKYESIQDVWYEWNTLNVATGAPCSSELKKVVRQKFIKKNPFSYQAFGFDNSEGKRVKGMKKNNSHIFPIFPIEHLSKEDCIRIINEAGVLIPEPYRLGFKNNNCFQTGCVQGGIGYWQKIKVDFPEKFEAMARMEHELTALKKEPVTILKDQSKGGGLVFLKPHADYPHMKDISLMRGVPVKPLADCNGFCSKHGISAE